MTAFFGQFSVWIHLECYVVNQTSLQSKNNIDHHRSHIIDFHNLIRLKIRPMPNHISEHSTLNKPIW